MKRFSTFFVICLTLNCWVNIVNAQTVRMPDANLAAVVQDALGLAPNAPITRQAMQGLTSLEASSWSIREITGQDGTIKDLTGLEHATQLLRLWLSGNQISDIRPLSGLTQLTQLWLYENQISDITPLARLTQLESLEIDGNPINNLRPLAKLTQLRHLDISVKRISDIQLHVDLTQLESLYIRGDWESRTPISDLHLLGNLTQLTNLGVYFASVSDLSFLRGLTQLEDLSLGGNQISDLKPLAGLTQLTWLGLGGNQISDLKPLAGLTNLNSLYLEGNPIQDASPLANLPNLHNVDIPIPPQISIRNEIPDELPQVGKNLRYRVQIRNAENVTGFKLSYEAPHHKLTAVKFVAYFDGVEHNPRTNPRSGTLTASRLETGQNIRNVAIFTLNATAAGKGDLRVVGQLTMPQRQFNVDIRYPITIFPSDEPQPSNNAGMIPDPNLAAVVRDELGLTSDAPITKKALKKLTELYAGIDKVQELTGQDSKIKDLTGLQYAAQLTRLEIGNNEIRNIQPLSGLTKLRHLDVWGNSINSIQPLSGLTKLRHLNIWGNSINDFSPLASLTQLKYFAISSFGIKKKL